MIAQAVTCCHRRKLVRWRAVAAPMGTPHLMTVSRQVSSHQHPTCGQASDRLDVQFASSALPDDTCHPLGGISIAAQMELPLAEDPKVRGSPRPVDVSEPSSTHRSIRPMQFGARSVPPPSDKFRFYIPDIVKSQAPKPESSQRRRDNDRDRQANLHSLSRSHHLTDADIASLYPPLPRIPFPPDVMSHIAALPDDAAADADRHQTLRTMDDALYDPAFTRLDEQHMSGLLETCLAGQDQPWTVAFLERFMQRLFNVIQHHISASSHTALPGSNPSGGAIGQEHTPLGQIPDNWPMGRRVLAVWPFTGEQTKRLFGLFVAHATPYLACKLLWAMQEPEAVMRHLRSRVSSAYYGLEVALLLHGLGECPDASMVAQLAWRTTRMHHEPVRFERPGSLTEWLAKHRARLLQEPAIAQDAVPIPHTTSLYNAALYDQLQRLRKHEAVSSGSDKRGPSSSTISPVDTMYSEPFEQLWLWMRSGMGKPFGIRTDLQSLSLYHAYLVYRWRRLYEAFGSSQASRHAWSDAELARLSPTRIISSKSAASAASATDGRNHHIFIQYRRMIEFELQHVLQGYFHMCRQTGIPPCGSFLRLCLAHYADMTDGLALVWHDMVLWLVRLVKATWPHILCDLESDLLRICLSLRESSTRLLLLAALYLPSQGHARPLLSGLDMLSALCRIPSFNPAISCARHIHCLTRKVCLPNDLLHAILSSYQSLQPHESTRPRCLYPPLSELLLETFSGLVSIPPRKLSEMRSHSEGSVPPLAAILDELAVLQHNGAAMHTWLLANFCLRDATMHNAASSTESEFGSESPFTSLSDIIHYLQGALLKDHPFRAALLDLLTLMGQGETPLSGGHVTALISHLGKAPSVCTLRLADPFTHPALLRALLFSPAPAVCHETLRSVEPVPSLPSPAIDRLIRCYADRLDAPRLALLAKCMRRDGLAALGIHTVDAPFAWAFLIRQADALHHFHLRWVGLAKLLRRDHPGLKIDTRPLPQDDCMTALIEPLRMTQLLRSNDIDILRDVCAHWTILELRIALLQDSHRRWGLSSSAAEILCQYAGTIIFKNPL